MTDESTHIVSKERMVPDILIVLHLDVHPNHKLLKSKWPLCFLSDSILSELHSSVNEEQYIGDAPLHPQ